MKAVIFIHILNKIYNLRHDSTIFNYISLANGILYQKNIRRRGAAARGVTVKPTGCGFDPHSRR